MPASKGKGDFQAEKAIVRAFHEALDASMPVRPARHDLG